MIPSEGTVNLTNAQADELLDVGLAYLQHIIGFSVADPAVLHMHLVSGYLTLLAVAALLENRHPSNGTGRGRLRSRPSSGARRCGRWANTSAGPRRRRMSSGPCPPPCPSPTPSPTRSAATSPRRPEHAPAEIEQIIAEGKAKSAQELAANPPVLLDGPGPTTKEEKGADAFQRNQ